MSWMKITGYADKFSGHPGDTIKFFVNCDGPAEYQAEIVKMIHGDTNPRGPGFIEEAIKAAHNATKTHPKYWKHGAQGLVTKWHDGKGYGLFMNAEGCIEFRINDQVITTGAPVRDHAWHFVAATFDAATGEATL